MEHDQIERKLVAILYADVAGYSRLTGHDEVGTHRNLSASLDIITASVERHQGKVLHFAGDAVLAEFPSVINALTCAVDIQHELRARNESLPEERRLEFRIGINLGDVIVDREEIYGDGVNVAARLESIAEAGGICISRAVFDQVRNKMEYEFEPLGDQQFKNIAEPVGAYRVLVESGISGDVTGENEQRRRGLRWLLLAIAGTSIIGLGTVIIRNDYPRLSLPLIDGVSKKSQADKLQTKPAIAVLPFRNLSGDSAQEYFSDGLTDDITTDLSKFRDLFVIASNTAFTYKGKAVNVRELSRELGVRYVLEGSVQNSGERVRVNVQLIDGTTGRHLWAERLDRDLNDLFALQDEIVTAIVATLATEVDEAERERAMRKKTENLEAYDYLLRGREFRSQTTRTANADAQKMFKRAVELDPRYGSAYAALGWCAYDRVLYGWTPSPSQGLEQAHELARKALDLDESNADAHHLLGSVYLKWMQYDLAISELERALELNPNDPDSYDALGEARLYTGQSDAANEAAQTALRFNPKASPRTLINLGLAYYLTNRYDDAIMVSEQALRRNPGLVVPHVVLAAAFAKADRTKEAERAANDVLRLDPFFEIDSFGTAFRSAGDRLEIANGLRKAGLK